MPNGQTPQLRPGEARCVGCNVAKSCLYPGEWGRSPSLNILLLDPEKGVGVCVKCVTPLNLSRYWSVIAPPKAVAG